MEYFDAHAHYDDEQFDEDRDELIKAMHDFGVTRIVCNGYSLKGSFDAYELTKKYDFIYSTAGISPNDLDENWEENINKIEELLDKPKVLAVGEIGLDYHYDTDKEIQKQAFIKQIELANKHNLPITIHTRDAVMDTIQILKDHPVNQKGVFHCCPFNRELVKEALKLGFYISFSGVCTFKNSNAEEIAKMVPNDKFTIETDSPYLSPVPNRGKRNDSRNLKYVVEKLSEFKGLSKEEIARLSYNNTINLYKIDI